MQNTDALKGNCEGKFSPFFDVGSRNDDICPHFSAPMGARIMGGHVQWPCRMPCGVWLPAYSCTLTTSIEPQGGKRQSHCMGSTFFFVKCATLGTPGVVLPSNGALRPSFPVGVVVIVILLRSYQVIAQWTWAWLLNHWACSVFALALRVGQALQCLVLRFQSRFCSVEHVTNYMIYFLFMF